MPLAVQPIDFREACAFVRRRHRHHRPPHGYKFGVACNDGAKVVGVATVGRPVARFLDDGLTLEVTRCCTDGTPNACSLLYGAAWRAARALGFRRMVTYTLPEEGGASLRASGARLVAETAASPWTRPNIGRVRADDHPICAKFRWEWAADGPAVRLTVPADDEAAVSLFDELA